MRLSLVFRAEASEERKGHPATFGGRKRRGHLGGLVQRSRSRFPTSPLWVSWHSQPWVPEAGPADLWLWGIQPLGGPVSYTLGSRAQAQPRYVNLSCIHVHYSVPIGTVDQNSRPDAFLPRGKNSQPPLTPFCPGGCVRGATRAPLPHAHPTPAHPLGSGSFSGGASMCSTGHVQTGNGPAGSSH